MIETLTTHNTEEKTANILLSFLLVNEINVNNVDTIKNMNTNDTPNLSLTLTLIKSKPIIESDRSIFVIKAK